MVIKSRLSQLIFFRIMTTANNTNVFRYPANRLLAMAEKNSASEQELNPRKKRVGRRHFSFNDKKAVARTLSNNYKKRSTISGTKSLLSV